MSGITCNAKDIFSSISCLAGRFESGYIQTCLAVRGPNDRTSSKTVATTF